MNPRRIQREQPHRRAHELRVHVCVLGDPLRAPVVCAEASGNECGRGRRVGLTARLRLDNDVTWLPPGVAAGPCRWPHPVILSASPPSQARHGFHLRCRAPEPVDLQDQATPSAGLQAAGVHPHHVVCSSPQEKVAARTSGAETLLDREYRSPAGVGAARPQVVGAAAATPTAHSAAAGATEVVTRRTDRGCGAQPPHRIPYAAWPCMTATPGPRPGPRASTEPPRHTPPHQQWVVARLATHSISSQTGSHVISDAKKMFDRPPGKERP
jgi:hypothetical protein